MPLQSTVAPPAQGTPTTAPAPVARTGSPDQIYQGLREQREVLGEQKRRVLNEREEITDQLREGAVSDGDRTGLENRLAATDQRLAQINIQIAEVDAQVAAAAAVPGAIVEQPERDPWLNGPPVELVVFGMSLSFVLLIPAAIAWARRLWRKASVISAVPPEVVDRISTMERNLETVALEIERIGEGQRFVTQLLAQGAERQPERIGAGSRPGGPGGA